MSRPSWDQYFLRLATEAAKRSTCDRAQVGAVLVRDRDILATGYNGALSGAPSCDDSGHLMIDGRCARAVHAEANAIARAARRGASLLGASAYVTHMPCWGCFKLLVAAGVRDVVYLASYRPDDLVVEHARLLGVEMRQVLIAEGATP